MKPGLSCPPFALLSIPIPRTPVPNLPFSRKLLAPVLLNHGRVYPLSVLPFGSLRVWQFMVGRFLPVPQQRPGRFLTGRVLLFGADT